MPRPDGLLTEKPEVVDEIVRLSAAMQWAQGVAAVLAIAGFALAMCAAVMKTEPSGCVYGVTRYFEVNPQIILAASSELNNADLAVNAKHVGGVRQTIRAMQIALGLPLVDVAADSTPQHGQWWSVANASRTLLDTPYEDMQHAGFFLVTESNGNATRLIQAGANLCDAEFPQLDASISTDTDSTYMRTREWRRCLPPLPSFTLEELRTYTGDLGVERRDTVNTASVKIVSPKRRRFRTTGDVARLFPEMREILTRTMKDVVPLEAMGHAFVSSLAMDNGFVAAQIHVLSKRPADPIADPASVRGIIVTLDPRVRLLTDELDATMRQVSHHAQQLLGRGVINFETSQKLDMLAVALLTS